MENVLIIIPARGGSKGIPGKNIKPLGGKKLLGYSIEVARELVNDNYIFLTTDSPEIKRVAEEEFGLKSPSLRSPALSTDHAGMREVLLDAAERFQATGKKVETIIMLQPTSPFRLARQVEAAYALFCSKKPDMVVSVKETDSNPYYILFEENDEGWLRPSKNGFFVRRQDCPVVYEYNGAIYVIDLAALMREDLRFFQRIIKYVMPELHSLDLDTPLDWAFAEFVLSKEGPGIPGLSERTDL